MKKRYIVLLMAAIAFIMLFPALRMRNKPYQRKQRIPEQLKIQMRQPEETEKNNESTWTLPASLQVIDDEAFEGTAIQHLELPETVTKVGDRAFADNDELLFIGVSGDLQYLGNDVFAGSEKAFLEVFAGTETMDLASEKGYRFFVAAAFTNRRITGTPSALMAGLRPEIRYEQKRSICSVDMKEKQTGRKDAELKEEKYRGTASLYVRSRYFP